MYLCYDLSRVNLILFTSINFLICKITILVILLFQAQNSKYQQFYNVYFVAIPAWSIPLKSPTLYFLQAHINIFFVRLNLAYVLYVIPQLCLEERNISEYFCTFKTLNLFSLFEITELFVSFYYRADIIIFVFVFHIYVDLNQPST